MTDKSNACVVIPALDEEQITGNGARNRAVQLNDSSYDRIYVRRDGLLNYRALRREKTGQTVVGQ